MRIARSIRMATERHDESYGDKILSRSLLVIIALFFLGASMIPTVVQAPRISTSGYLLLVTWGIVLVSGVVWVGRLRYCYGCPTCGSRLPLLPLERATKYRHRFHCAKCDVVWTTGVYDGDA